jgi:SAM-dependent MidA family methyltransferase
MQDALYGAAGFYVRGPGPERHFRTSVTASPAFARAIHTLLDDVDRLLHHPGTFQVVDVGAGDGSLLTGVRALLSGDQRARWQLTGVDLRGRPEGLPPDLDWAVDPPDRVVGALVAHELLDNVPLDVVQQTRAGLRLVSVDDTGDEHLAGSPSTEDLDWLARWWPMERSSLGDRAEVGHPRDAVCAQLLGSLVRGAAVAVDYAHTLEQRTAGSWAAGTLTGYRDGRQVEPVPDGTCDLTAHVALDACAAAGTAAGATASLEVDQRTALHRLGVAGTRPPLALALTDPAAYVAALSRASEAAELTQLGGLGDFSWLVQTRGVPLPQSLVGASEPS